LRQKMEAKYPDMFIGGRWCPGWGQWRGFGNWWPEDWSPNNWGQ
jgi:hypothetical protein